MTMMKMNRRDLIASISTAFLVPLSGCEVLPPGEDPITTLDLTVGVVRAEDQWELTSQASIGGPGASLSNVKLVAFNQDGDLVCKKQWGDMSLHNMPKETITTRCESFPVVISVTADQSACDNANLEIQFWTGNEVHPDGDYSEGTINWDSTFQRCNEPLPPDRVLRQVLEPTNPSATS